MTRRARYRGKRIGGLFGFDSDGQPTTEVDETPDNPRMRKCPTCGAAEELPCRTRTRRRTQMTNYHDARMSPQETT